MAPVITPEPEDWFVSWMRSEWKEHSPTGGEDEVEFWKFFKMIAEMEFDDE